MYLGNQVLPLSLSAKEALTKVETVLRQKNWNNFDSGELKLVLIPYYLYNYNYHTEIEKEGKTIVESSKDGMLALNGSSLKVEEKTVGVIQENLSKTKQDAPPIEHEVKTTSLSKATQEHILKIKTAEFFEISKDNVVISNVKKVMFPMYESFITIEEKTHEIIVNGVSGDVYGIEEVGEREKGFIEITKETLRDLKDPAAWLKYTKGLAVETGKFLRGQETNPGEESSDGNVSVVPSESKLSFLTSKWFLVLIIILALFLIYLAFIA